MTTKRKQTILGVDTAINGVVSDPNPNLKAKHVEHAESISNECAAIPLDCV